MLGDINRNLEPEEYELILCKPDKTQIGVLNANNIIYEARFPTTDELTFSIPYGENYYDLVKGDYLILLNDEKYFIIETPEEIGNGIEIKSVHCYSLEYMLNKKVVRKYNLPSRRLYTLTDELDSDGYSLGVMNHVKTLTSWKLDTNSFLNFTGLGSTYRSFDVSEKSLFEFLINDVQSAFECVFLFDTLTKTISVKTLDQLQGNKGLYISEGNYIKTINKQIKNDEIKTRLYCYGNDISINGINPTGTSYIEDYTFYKHVDYMSQALIDALNAYEANIDFNSTTYSNLLDDLSILGSEMSILQTNLANAKTSLEIAQDNLDVAISKSQSLSQLNIELTNAENEVEYRQSLVNTKQNEINAKYVEINNYRDSIDISNYINTAELIEEFDNFIKEATWNDENYIDSIDLLEAGKKKLSKLSTPPLLFEIEIVDFLQAVECQHDWHKLVLGDIVYVEFPKFNVDIEVRLIGYTHDPKNKSLKLNFSNKSSIDDPYVYFNDLISNAITSSSTLNMNKKDWDNKANTSVITELRNENINATLQNVLAGKNQSVVTDRRGIWLTEKDENGLILPEQMRIINNAIVLSKDNWQTASLALTPDGINALTLWGKTVIANDGLFDGIEVFDGMSNPVVEIGRYMDGEIEKRGIRITGGALEIVGGLTEAQLEQTLQDKINAGGLPDELHYNNVVINALDGLVSTRDDIKVRSILNATKGIAIQKNTGTVEIPIWADNFYVDLNAVIHAEDLVANRLIMKNGEDVLINGDTKVIDFSKFLTIAGTINADNINLKGVNVLNELEQTTLGIDLNGNLSLKGNITMTGGSINWENINPPTASDVGAKPYDWNPAISDVTSLSGMLTWIDQNGIYTGTLTAQQIMAIQGITTLNVSGTLNCGNTIEIGAPNELGGQCHINTAEDGMRFQAHVPGNYYNYSDDGSLSFFVGDTRIATIFADGTTDLTSIGEGGGCPLVYNMLLNYLVDGVAITKDDISETWTWTKDELGNITGMYSNKGRTVSIS